MTKQKISLIKLLFNYDASMGQTEIRSDLEPDLVLKVFAISNLNNKNTYQFKILNKSTIVILGTISADFVYAAKSKYPIFSKLIKKYWNVL